MSPRLIVPYLTGVMAGARAWSLAGLGAVLGMAAGAFRGVMVVHRTGEWAQRTPWLAGASLAHWVSLLGLAGALCGLLLALAVRRRPLGLLDWTRRPFLVRASQGSLVLGVALFAWPWLSPWTGSLRAG